MSISFTRPAFAASTAPRLVSRIVRLNLAWQQKRRLDRMGDAGLRDMGMTRAMRDAITVTDLSDRVLG